MALLHIYNGRYCESGHSFTDWLNYQIIRDQLKFDIKVCLIKFGSPPQYSSGGHRTGIKL